MDGNGRWAKEQGFARILGHQKGVDTIREIVKAARELKIKYLTLFAFSKENWNRPNEETQALMALLFNFLTSKKEKMLKNGIRLNAIGDLNQLPKEVRDLLFKTIEETSVGREMVLTLALSYGSRDEILRAVKVFSEKLIDKKMTMDHLDEAYFSGLLDTRHMPDPDLIIRTSGENRVSNFLLWQLAYAELFFTDCFWPDFTENHFKNAIEEYQLRERRYGLTSKQIEGTHQK